MAFLKRFRSPKEPPRSPAEVARANAEAFIAAALEAGVSPAFDYSQESVFRLDAFIANGWDFPISDQTYKAIPPVMGAYIGEVMVQHLDGSWAWGVGTPIVKFQEGEIDPALWVRKRLNSEHPQYIAMAYTALRVRLGRGGPEPAPNA